MASDIAALIDKLQLGSVNILGWSDGGNTGLELAYAHPDKVKKLITSGANYTHETGTVPDDSIKMDQDNPSNYQIPHSFTKAGDAGFTGIWL